MDVIAEVSGITGNDPLSDFRQTISLYMWTPCQDVAQSGYVFALEAEGRWFESSHPDQHRETSR